MGQRLGRGVVAGDQHDQGRGDQGDVLGHVDLEVARVELGVLVLLKQWMVEIE